MAKKSMISLADVYSAREVAKICGVVNQTAINWIQKKYLKAYTTPGGQYRVFRKDLVNFLTDREIEIPMILRG